MPLGMYFALVLVWFVVSIPLTFVGGYAALRMPIADHPVKTNQIPRHVPPPHPTMHPWVLFFAGVPAKCVVARGVNVKKHSVCVVQHSVIKTERSSVHACLQS